MYLKLVGCLCFLISFINVRSQRGWGSGGYNTGSSSWTPNGFSNQNIGVWGLNRPNQAGLGGNQQFNIPFGINTNRGPTEQQLFGDLNNGNFDWNSEKTERKKSEVSGSSDTRKPDEKKFASTMIVPNTNSNTNTFTNTFSSSGNNSPWGFHSQISSSGNQNSKKNSNNINSNIDSSDTFLSESNDSSFSPFGSNKPSGFSSQNSKPNNNKNNNNRPNSFPSGQSNWGNNKQSGQNSNNFNSISNNYQGGNEIPSDSDYEYNSVYSWNSNDKQKNQPSKNKWEATTSKPFKSTKKPQKPTNSNQSGNEKTPKEANVQNENKTTVDTSILDELDKNDWYFGKESNYPMSPFKSVLNIDVSELWNFDKNRKPNQNSNGGKNRGSNNNRRNRQTGEERAEGIQCECVDVNLCDEENSIITQEDVKYDVRPLEAFMCEHLTEVCCTNPKLRFSNRARVQGQTADRLQCGQRRMQETPFGALGGNIGEPGEFPWSLQLQNSELNCSASLIHPQLALTAAHCVESFKGDLKLKAGIWNSNDEPPQIREVSKIIPHPAYNSQNPRNDIALLVMENGFDLTNNVNTICLPVTNDKWDSDQCLVAGWRLEEVNGEVVEVLEKEPVDFIPQPECQNIMLVTDLWRNYILHDSFICGREKTGSNACLGSEGGPVMCLSKKQPDTYLQIGLVSEGMNCDHFGRPGIFTNVLKFLDWINKNHFDLGLNFDIDIRTL